MSIKLDETELDRPQMHEQEQLDFKPENDGPHIK